MLSSCKAIKNQKEARQLLFVLSSEYIKEEETYVINSAGRLC